MLEEGICPRNGEESEIQIEQVDLEGIKKWIQEGPFKVERSYIDEGKANLFSMSMRLSLKASLKTRITGNQQEKS